MPEITVAGVQAAMDSAVRHHGELGIQVAAYQNDRLVLDLAVGAADPATGAAVTHDTLFPVFSATKAVTATAVHLQVSRGLLDYNRPVADFWPEFARHGKGAATVMDVLTHRVGIPQMPDGITPELMCDWDYMVGRVAELEPMREHGTRT